MGREANGSAMGGEAGWLILPYGTAREGWLNSRTTGGPPSTGSPPATYVEHPTGVSVGNLHGSFIRAADFCFQELLARLAFVFLRRTRSRVLSRSIVSTGFIPAFFFFLQ